MSLYRILAITFIFFGLGSCGHAQKVFKKTSDIRAPFDGKRFQNFEPFPDKGFFSLMGWQLRALFYRQSWPSKLENPQYKIEDSRSQQLKITVINHSTVLIQVDGLNFLTDPHYSERASPLSWAGPKRVISPGIAFEDLPPIDAVLISHDHYDHLDLPTLKRLSERDGPQVYVGLGNKPLLEKYGIANVVEMDWWDQKELRD